MGKHFNCTGGVAGYIDRQVFGEHMYRRPECQKVYENVVYFDPEGMYVLMFSNNYDNNFFLGILGTLTSILTVYLGVQAGRTLNTYQNVKAKMIRWIIWGVSAVSSLKFQVCRY